MVLNQGTGAMMATRSFDTYSTKDDSNNLISFISDLADGRIVCFAVKVTGCSSAREKPFCYGRVLI